MIEINPHKDKKLAVLIDPDKADNRFLNQIIDISKNFPPDCFLVGGSLLVNDRIEFVIQFLKEKTSIPVYIFPGNMMQTSPKADGILLLSLISGRNAEFLIGQHVLAAPKLKRDNINIIPTGYILVGGTAQTSVEYMSQTAPIPNNKNDIASATALAGEMLGMKMIYLEAGSGAENSLKKEMISAVKNTISIPLIVGGGIKNAHDACEIFQAGAKWIVVGTAIEKNPDTIKEFYNLSNNIKI